MAAVTNEQAQEMVRKLAGTTGLNAAIEAMKKELVGKHHKFEEVTRQIELGRLVQEQLRGTVVALENSIATMEHVAKECGLTDLAIETVQTPVARTQGVAPVQNVVLSPEIQGRMKKKQCCFKGDLGDGKNKWCARKLRTKPQFATGYCEIHFEHTLGISEVDWKKEQKK